MASLVVMLALIPVIRPATVGPPLTKRSPSSRSWWITNRLMYQTIKTGAVMIMAWVNHTWSEQLAAAERAALAGEDGPARAWALESPYRFTIRELLGFGMIVAILMGISQGAP